MSKLLNTLVPSRSWEYLTGKQLDCFTCVSADTSDDVMDEAAAVSSVTGTSADGGVLAASATLQSDAAKQDLGDDDDADLGIDSLLPSAFDQRLVFAFEGIACLGC